MVDPAAGFAPLRLLRRAAVLPIVAYRRWISPWTPPSCRFQPTCSAYTEEAVLRHGIVKGVLLGTWRILRCQPFSTGGPEPVPARGRWRSEPPPVSLASRGPHGSDGAGCSEDPAEPGGPGEPGEIGETDGAKDAAEAVAEATHRGSEGKGPHHP